MEPTERPVTTRRHITSRIACLVLLALGVLVTAVLILIQAARSHFPVLAFAAVLVVALVVHLHAQSRRRGALGRTRYEAKAVGQLHLTDSPKALPDAERVAYRAATATNDSYSHIA